jgi:hypothetical protein
MELLATAHGQGSFDRAVHELKQHMGRDVQTEERRERTKCRQNVYAKVGNVTSSLGTSDEYTIIGIGGAEGELDEGADHSEQETTLAHHAREPVVGVADWSAIWMRIRSDFVLAPMEENLMLFCMP